MHNISSSKKIISATLCNTNEVFDVLLLLIPWMSNLSRDEHRDIPK